jgi:hypothetical protein
MSGYATYRELRARKRKRLTHTIQFVRGVPLANYFRFAHLLPRQIEPFSPPPNPLYRHVHQQQIHPHPDYRR